MFEKISVQSLIEDRIPFRPISTGWVVGKCQLPGCNDYKERAGFKFEDGQVIYNCWNCSTASRYEEFSGKMSRKFRTILNTYGLEDSEINTAVHSVLFKKDQESATITLEKLTKVNTQTPTIKLPEKSFPLGHHEFLDYQEKLVSYLIDRKVDFNKYPFFFSLEPRFKNRIIIPYYRNGNLIYWQARSIDPNEKKRYDNAPAMRDAIMFNMDQLFKFSTAPLFISEGVFDAMMVDGVCLLGSRLNEAKAELLSSSSRRLVFVIDKDSNGKHLAEDVLARGWDITFVRPEVEDINQSVQRFGLSYTIYELIKSIPPKDKAKFAIAMNCKHEPQKFIPRSA